MGSPPRRSTAVRVIAAWLVMAGNLARRSTAVVRVIAAWLVMAAALPAMAAPDVLEWTAPPECPDARQLRSRIEDLAGMPAASWPTGFAVRGQATQIGGRWRVVLAFAGYGAASRRVFDGGDTCVAVCEAAALHIALGLEARAPGKSARDPQPAATAARPTGQELPRIAVEVAIGAQHPIDASFSTNDIAEPIYQSEADFERHVSVAVVIPVTRHLSLVNSLATLNGAEVTGPVSSLPYQEFTWQGLSAGFLVRGGLPLWGGVTPFLEAGGGPALTEGEWFDGDGDHRETNVNWHLRAGAGLAVALGRRVSLFAELSYITAPVDYDQLNGTHNNGGTILVVGGRLNFYDRSDR